MRRALVVVVSIGIGLLVGAPPAVAAPQDMSCELSIGSESPLPAWTPDMTLTVDPAEVDAGNDVTLTLDVGSYTNGPVPIPAGQLVPNATITLSGGQTGETSVAAEANAEAILAQGQYVVSAMQGPLTVTGDGQIDLSVTEVFFDNPVVDIVCTPSAEPVVLATITASGGTAPEPTATDSEASEEPSEPTDSPSEEPSGEVTTLIAPEEEDDGGSPLPWVILGVVLLAVLGGGGYLLFRRSQAAGGP